MILFQRVRQERLCKKVEWTLILSVPKPQTTTVWRLQIQIKYIKEGIYESLEYNSMARDRVYVIIYYLGYFGAVHPIIQVYERIAH